MSWPPRLLLPALAGLVGVAVLAGCGSSSGIGSAGQRPSKLRIEASFYPLQYVTQRIVGDRGTVGSLTPPGAEPHDLELTAKAVARVHDADLVVYLKGFQPSVDDAVSTEAKQHGVDVRPAAALDRTLAEAHEGSGTDPHFWLDPERLSAVSTLIERRLELLAPADVPAFRANLAGLTTELTGLDRQFAQGLAHCANRDLVTSHQAFGYLSERYHLTQVGISANTPEEEPNPAALASVTEFVKAHDVRTIYYEALASPVIARTVARETGARSAELDPIEGLTAESQGSDYFGVMHANLRNLMEGQSCS